MHYAYLFYSFYNTSGETNAASNKTRIIMIYKAWFPFSAPELRGTTLKGTKLHAFRVHSLRKRANSSEFSIHASFSSSFPENKAALPRNRSFLLNIPNSLSVTQVCLTYLNCCFILCNLSASRSSLSLTKLQR